MSIKQISNEFSSVVQSSAIAQSKENVEFSDTSKGTLDQTYRNREIIIRKEHFFHFIVHFILIFSISNRFH